MHQRIVLGNEEKIVAKTAGSVHSNTIINGIWRKTLNNLTTNRKKYNILGDTQSGFLVKKHSALAL